MHDALSVSDLLAVIAILIAAVLAHWGNRLPVVSAVIASALSAVAMMLAWMGAGTASAAGQEKVANAVAMAGGVLAMAPALFLRSRSYAAASKLRPGLEIVSPVNGQTIPHAYGVRGTRANKDQTVQVFVFGGASWWLQGPALPDDLTWEAKSWVGREGAYSERFELIAVADLGFSPKEIKEFPAGIAKSKPVVVYRQPRPSGV